MYVDLAGLARYKSDFGAWARGALLPKDAAAARVRTAKAGAVSFVPVQETPLDVSVDFLFAETPPASGDKSPANPSTIAGVSEIVVGLATKNVLSLQLQRASGADFTFQKYDDGSFRITGTTLATNVEELVNLVPRGTSYPAFAPGEKYTVSFYSDSNLLSVQAYCRATSGSYVGLLSGNIYNGNSATMTIPSYVSATNDLWLRVKINNNNTAVDINALCKVQIELGETATNFVPALPSFDETHIPLGSTYYGGEIDLATGLMTVTMQYMVADSNAEIIWIGTNFVAWRFPAGLNCIGRAVGTEVCSHFPFSGAWDGSFAHFYATPSSGLYLANPNWTASTYRQYFTDQYNNGTPVTACYQLANPFTVQLTPTEILSLTQSSDYDPRVNTVYSDQQAVQVGYLKHPSAASADLRNALVSLGGGV